MPFNSNEVILSQSEIDLIMAQTEQWLLNDPCMSKQRGHRNEELESYRSG